MAAVAEREVFVDQFRWFPRIQNGVDSVKLAPLQRLKQKQSASSGKRHNA
jgi:hypothetical protein